MGTRKTRSKTEGRKQVPRSAGLPSCELDLRVGGKFRYVMRGTIHDDPAQVITTTVNFLEENGKTKLVVNQSYTSESAAAGAPIGWSQMLDRLVDYLEKQ